MTIIRSGLGTVTVVDAQNNPQNQWYGGNLNDAFWNGFGVGLQVSSLCKLTVGIQQEFAQSSAKEGVQEATKEGAKEGVNESAKNMKDIDPAKEILSKEEVKKQALERTLKDPRVLKRIGIEIAQEPLEKLAEKGIKYVLKKYLPKLLAKKVAQKAVGYINPGVAVAFFAWDVYDFYSISSFTLDIYHEHTADILAETGGSI